MNDLPDVVKNKISRVQRNRLTSLNLSSYALGVNVPRIDSFPEEILELEELVELNLRGQNLTHVPSEIHRLKNLTILRLSGNRIESLPQSITHLTRLEYLDMEANPLSKVPECIVDFQYLRDLNLSQIGMKELPNWLINLKSLESLNLSNNKLHKLPEWIGNLQGLSMLRLFGCSLTEIPSSLGLLRNLNRLFLGHNDINVLPETIGDLISLSYINLSYNNLSNLPNSLSKLKNLIHLILGNNSFDFIPSIVFQMSSLQMLYLNNHDFIDDHSWNGSESPYKNNINEIPSGIVHLRNLNSFLIAGNPIVHPPPEIVGNGEFRSEGLAKLRNYYRQLETEGTDYLYEAKLLIVGEGGAGKTTLANKIGNPNYELQDEASTKGIEVIKWFFPMPDGQIFHVNIWDFGGQEIYHTTHQFFLTKRSLYLLVADSRKEDTDFDYWLNVVELLSDKSPLLIIKNEKQDRQRAINERQLRGQFKSLQKTLPTNLANNRGLDTILEEIKQYITHLPHVGAALPKTWVDVRKILENDSRDYISLEEYLDICENNGFREQKDKLQLSEYLHDLGVCLHFQNDPVLRDVIVLKPQWGTDAAYRVLDNPTVIANFGHFSKDDLADIWSENQYAHMHDALLRLMMNFKLCYAIPKSDLYIAPQLLNINQADYEWDEADNLYLRYAYPDFMPKGIVTRFIVELHGIIADNRQRVWRNGVVLEQNGANAEVIEFYGKREIQIRVVGKDKKSLRKTIARELDKINEAFHGLKYAKLIPCICDTCANSITPHFFPYEVLRNALHHHQPEVQCFKSYEMVRIDQLLDNLEDDNIFGIESAQSLQ